MTDLRRGFLGIQLAASTFHPFDYDKLTQGGVQYTDGYFTTGDDWEEADIAKFDFGMPIELTEAYFDLRWQMSSTGNLESCSAKWQIRTRHGAWHDITGVFTDPAGDSAYGNFTAKGYVDLKDTTNQLPLEVRLLVKSDAAGGELGAARISNATLMRFIPKMLGIIQSPIEPS